MQRKVQGKSRTTAPPSASTAAKSSHSGVGVLNSGMTSSHVLARRLIKIPTQIVATINRLRLLGAHSSTKNGATKPSPADT